MASTYEELARFPKASAAERKRASFAFVSRIRQTSRWLARVNLQPNDLLAVQGDPPAVGKPVHEKQTKVLVPFRILDVPRIESERPAAVSHRHPQGILILLKL